ncbi:MAG: hypothetical protein ABFD07_05585 [Methanobacterium sp.]
MKTIYKYELKMGTHQFCDLPKGSKPLRAEFRNDGLCVWVLIPDTKVQLVSYSFYVIGTGWEIEEDIQLKYISTVFD